MMRNSSLWLPCTQMKDFERTPPIHIKRGEGVYLYDEAGHRYIDSISSWWVNLFGHANSRIGDKIKAQIDTLEHTILANFTHDPVVQLSNRLVDITPAGLNHCFYADNGSSAVEVSLKMSYHYWYNLGRPNKSKFVCLSGSYHGETMGALAVGDVELYKETYSPLLMEVLTAQSPDSYGKDPVEAAQSALLDMRQLLQQNHRDVSAVIIEPLVQCAGSMRMYHPDYLTGLRALCDEFDVHLIADEVAVGFGRTGTLFACEQGNITPDFMTLSKGLTGGYLPLAVCLTTTQVYEAFYDDYTTLKAFLHSHSYTGNPIGCAAANATLDIFEQDDVIGQNQKTAKAIAKALSHLSDHPNVGDVRQTGMIAAVEMVKEKSTLTPFDWQERRGRKIYEYALTQGALIRPLGDVAYFMPPYVVTVEQIELLAEILSKGIDYASA